MQVCNKEECRELKERTHHEQKLAEETQLYREIFEHIADYIFLLEVVDENRFRYVKINRNLSELLGMPIEIEHENWPERSSGPIGDHLIAEKILSAAKRCVQKSGILTENIEVSTPSGMRYLDLSLTPLTGTSGRIDRILAVFRDVSELKRNEQKADFMDLAVDQLHDGVFLADPESHRITYANRKLCQLLGYRRSELIGLTIPNIDPNFGHLEVAEVWESVLNEGSANFETLLKRKDGTRFPVEISVSEILHENRPMGLSLVRDISERKAAEEALRQKEERHRRFFEHELVGMAITSPETGWLEVNNKLCAMLGYAREELLNLTWSELTHPDDLKPDLDQFDRMLKGEIESYTLEKRYIRKDRGIVYANLSIACVRSPDGTVDYVQVLIEDITERKHATEQLESSRKMLAEAQEIAQLGSWDWDVVKDRVAWSEMAFEIYTPDKRPADPGYQEFLQSLHIADKERVMAAVQSAFDHGIPFDIEHRVVSESKGVRTVHAQAKVFRDAQGKPIRMVGTVQDVTERKRVESDRKILSDILEASPDFVGTCDMQGQLEYHNPTARRMVGLPEDTDFSDMRISDMHPEWATNLIFETAIPTVLEQGVWRGESALLHRDGREVPVQQTIMLHRDADGKPLCTSTIMQDITERKRLEAERQQHLNFFESMDRVNRALQSSNDLETAMNEVLETLLEIFACDRAYLIYPCDPDAANWQVPFERTVPEYPGAGKPNLVMPMDQGAVATFRQMLNSEGPVTYGLGNQFQVSDEIAERFRIRSFIASALHPKGDKPWLFGIHQCSRDRAWTAEEQQMFQEIGRRITDSLTNLLAFREVQEREQKFRILADSMPDSICRYDLQLRKVDANLKLRRILDAEFGHSWLGKTPKELYLDGSMDLHQARLAQVIETGGCEDLEGSQPDAQFGRRYFQIRYAALRDYDEKIIGALAIFTYITLQRQLEQALIRNERELRMLLASTPCYIARFDLDLRSTFVSKAYEEVAKTAAAQVIGKTPLEYWPLASPPAKEFCGILRRIIDTKQSDRLDSYAITSAGTRRYFSVDLAPELDENGNVTAVLAAGLETTELKTAEQRRLEAREDERKIIARELHDDLGQRLTALRLDMQILELRFGRTSPELSAQIKEIDSAIGDTIAIVRNLLTMLRPMILDLGLVPALEWLVGSFRKKTSIDCRLQLPQENIEFNMEQATAVFRVVQESLNNIAKHAEARKVEIMFGRNDSGYFLEICDDGKGFDVEVCRKKAESFGLQGIEERIHLLGAQLAIDSAPGCGTTLTVSIPTALESGYR